MCYGIYTLWVQEKLIKSLNSLKKWADEKAGEENNWNNEQNVLQM